MPARAVAQHPSDLAGQERAQVEVAERREPADRRHAGRGEPLLRARADARQRPHGERREERGLGARQARP